MRIELSGVRTMCLLSPSSTFIVAPGPKLESILQTNTLHFCINGNFEAINNEEFESSELSITLSESAAFLEPLCASHELVLLFCVRTLGRVASVLEILEHVLSASTSPRLSEKTSLMFQMFCLVNITSFLCASLSVLNRLALHSVFSYTIFMFCIALSVDLKDILL